MLVRILSLGTLLMLWAISAAAERPQSLDLAKIVTDPHLASVSEMLEDPTQRLDLAAIMTRPDSDWQPVAADVLPISYSRSAWWVRLTVINTGEQIERRILEAGWPLLDWLDMFVIGEDGRRLAETHIGDQQPFADRPLRTRVLAIPFEVPPHAKRTLFLRLALSDGVMDRVPLRLWDRADLAENLEAESLGMGLYFGAILAIMVYNLLLGITTRDRNFLRYSAYLALFALWIFGFRGFGYAQLWPAYPRFNNLFNLVLPVAYWVMAAAFVTGYLETRNNFPILHHIVRTAAGLLMVLALISMADIAGLDMPMTMVSSVHVALITLLGILFIVCGVFAYQHGNRSARYFLLAWSCLIIGGLLYVISSLPGRPILQNVITENGISIGSTLEFLLLSLALGDRYRTLQQQQRTMQLAVERVALRQSVLDTITHELRTPLTVISTAAQMLALGIQDPESGTRRRLRDILGATQRLSALIDPSVDGHAPIHWDGQLVFEPCDLNRLLQAVAEGAQPLASEHRVRVELSAIPLQLGCDPGLTRLALSNLMDNAIKHNPPGTTVVLRAGADEQGGWLEVEDSGRGLPPEALARIFEPGYRQNQQVPGTGYGLTLARQMIETQGGTLTAESTPGQATRFRIRLPGKPQP